ncbi:hypothetical protein V2I29_07930 [Campylobacter sp. CX2-8023-23]|uniref:hypothetical protein n=1 Tax=Campylobacter porcelli TaxID=1660073 RepID=UPI002EC1BD44|nr:hypothetical protein [Campylobacter sp. CX2-8023-23]
MLNLDTNKLISDYKQIEASIISENSIFDKAIKYLDDSFNDKTLAPKDKYFATLAIFTILWNFLRHLN